MSGDDYAGERADFRLAFDDPTEANIDRVTDVSSDYVVASLIQHIHRLEAPLPRETVLASWDQAMRGTWEDLFNGDPK